MTYQNFENFEGRFPANLLVSDDVLNVESKGALSPVKSGQKGFGGVIYGKYKSGGDDGKSFYSDKEKSTSFSRYFSLDAWLGDRIKDLPESVHKTFPFLLVPKASKGEKNKGLKNIKAQYLDPSRKVGSKGGTNPRNRGAESLRKNFHPTVKPVKLMSYLITLGSRKDDLVLDPFLGSGTTAVACKQLSRDFIGFEINPDYCKIAEKRLANVPEKLRKWFS